MLCLCNSARGTNLDAFLTLGLDRWTSLFTYKHNDTKSAQIILALDLKFNGLFKHGLFRFIIIIILFFLEIQSNGE